jgi:hypothetical protein
MKANATDLPPTVTAPAEAVTALYQAHALGLIRLAVSTTTHGPAGGTASQTPLPGQVVAGPPISSYVASGRVPPSYVAITSRGNPNFHPSYAVVRATVSGQTLATIQPSAADSTIVAATAAADDRTFVLDEQHWATTVTQGFEARTFYLFRLGASGRPGPLARLPMTVPKGQLLTGLALSPDGSKLAMAIQPDNNKNKPDLTQVRVYTLTTGAMRTWTGDGTIGAYADDAPSLSWADDESTLAFDWAAAGPGIHLGVWLLDLGARGGNLIADSRQAVSLLNQATLDQGAPAATAGQPTCPDPILTPDGSAVVCGAIAAVNQTVTATGLKRGAVTEFREYSAATGKVTRILGHWKFASVGGLSAEVLWSNASGSVLIGVIPTAGDGRVGVISGNTFTPLPAPAVPSDGQSGTW